MAKKRGRARVSFARLSTTSNVSRLTLLEASLARGTHVEHYGRRWIMGPVSLRGGCYVGTVGVGSDDGGSARVWDYETEDFVTTTVPEGETTPWALRISTLQLAFQLKPRINKPQGFASGFRRLLNESAGEDFWSVQVETSEDDFETWVGELDRLERFSIRLDRPNPNYADRENVEEIIEEGHIEKVQVAAIAADGESMDPMNVELFREGIAHVDAGYGRYRAQGRVGGGIVRFDSERRQAPPELELPADHETGDAFPDSLRRALGDESPVSDDETDGEIDPES